MAEFRGGGTGGSGSSDGDGSDDSQQDQQTGANGSGPGSGGGSSGSGTSANGSSGGSNGGGSGGGSGGSSSGNGGSGAGSGSESAAEQIAEAKRRAVEAAAAAAAGAAEGIEGDVASSGGKSRNKRFVEEAQRTAQMAAPTDHSLETMDQSGQVTEMARSAPDNDNSASPDARDGNGGGDGNGDAASERAAGSDRLDAPGGVRPDGDPLGGDTNTGGNAGAGESDSLHGGQVTEDDSTSGAGGAADGAGGPPDDSTDAGDGTPDLSTTGRGTTQGENIPDDAGQGVETGSGEVAERARELEQQVLDQLGEGYTAEDVKVTQDGETLSAQLNAPGRVEARAQARAQQRAALAGLGVEETAGGTLVAPDVAGRETLAEQEAAEQQARALAGLGFEVSAGGRMQGPDAAGRETLAEDRASERRVRALAGLGFEGAGENRRGPDAAGSRTLAEQRAAARAEDRLEDAVGTARANALGIQNPQLREAVKEQTDLDRGEDYTISSREDGGVSVKLTEQGRQEVAAATTTPGETAPQAEEFGDWDWSFGLFGEGDEVEGTLEDASRAITGTAQDTANYLFEPKDSAGQSSGPKNLLLAAGFEDLGRAYEKVSNKMVSPTGNPRQSMGEEILRAAGREDLGRQYEEGLRNFGKGTVQGTAAIVNLPGLAKTGLEAAELVGYGASETLAGRSGEFTQDVSDQSMAIGQAVKQQATENPAQTAGLLAGGLAGSYGIMSTARAVGPRAGAAARWAVQPGEEAVGRLGYGATRLARGRKTADRYFPNKEPVVFSEEAALRGAQAARSRLGDLSPTSRVRSAAGEVSRRTPNARLVKDPDSGPVSVDSELSREIGDTVRRYRDAARERLTPSGDFDAARGLRAGGDRPSLEGAASSAAGRTAQQARNLIESVRRLDRESVMPSASREGVAPLIAGAQRASVEGGASRAANLLAFEARRRGVQAQRYLSDLSSREGVAPLVRGADRPSLEAGAASVAGRTAQQAQDLLDTMRGLDRGDLTPSASREGVAPLVAGGQRPSVTGGLADAGQRAQQVAADALLGGGREGVAPLVAGAQRPSLTGEASRAANVLAFEGRRRGLQAREAASDLPGRIADARRAYTLALQSDVQEAASGVDTRYRQYRSLLRETEAADVRDRLSGLGDYTLRFGPSEAHWSRGSGGGERVTTQMDVGGFEGFDVEGVLGEVDAGDAARSVETETDARAETDADEMDFVDQDAGDGLVAREARAESEPVDTSRTGTGTDAMRTGSFAVSRPVAAALFGGQLGDQSGGTLPLGRELVESRPRAGVRPWQDTRGGLGMRQSGFDVEFGVGRWAETEQDPQSRTETRPFIEIGVDARERQEAEQEQERDQRSEFENDPRGDSREERPWERNPVSVSDGGSSSVERGLGAGWFNEFATAFALGAGPREAATADADGAVALTEQRQTQAQAEGSEAVEAAEAALLFEGVGVDATGDSGGGDSWFDF